MTEETNPSAADATAEDPVVEHPITEPTTPDSAPESSEPESGVAALPLRPAIESILLVIDEPIDLGTLAAAVDRPTSEVEAELRALAAAYTEEERGFDLREIGGGWRLYTRERYAAVVERFVLDGQQARLTQAALETLAVVAYRQPVSRARVSAIRGVNCDGVIRTLLNRSLLEEAGSDSDSGATLYRTTSYFLERLGLASLEELPDLAPYLPEIDQVELEETREQAAPATEAGTQPDPEGSAE